MHTVQAWLKAKQRSWQFKKLKNPKFTHLFTPTIPGRYVCFDCETTGLSPKQDKIISLSAIIIEDNQVLTSQALNLWIKQSQPINAKSIKVHRIRNADLTHHHNVMNEQEAISQFLKFIEGATLVGYFLEFDVAMINQVIKPWLGVNLPHPQIEVSKLYYAQQLAKQSPGVYQGDIDLRFKVMLNQLQIPNFAQHDAFSDALMTALMFIKLNKYLQP
ncbi:3'-5' exonuclease [Thiomicrorhabdus aquaedulcis]|uniref:3'-5' exonuclease n=1 Tax=Thiomicrorhabdus aquaedulcis TaxID=2211106 RepID=UPI000FD9B233|nr:3'-5' exonuclease [Thiomicrorhabdus aquaedulcis]